MNEMYPSIAIKTHTSLEKSKFGYRWHIEMLIEGPDDYDNVVGPWFATKHLATMDMLSNYLKVTTALFERLME